MKSDLYFLALVPPHPQLEQLQAIKQNFGKQYDCHVALRSPPHITLIPPFRLQSDAAVELKHDLGPWSIGQSGFDLQLDGYGCFSPRVIYLNVVSNAELINFQIELRQHLILAVPLLQKGSQPFNPHLTLGTRDLRKSEFHQAWLDLQNQEIEVSWPVDRLTILRHNGKSWDVLHSCLLGSSRTGISSTHSE